MKIDLDNLSKLDKYRENLLVSDDAVFSYMTKVAEINHEKREITPIKWHVSGVGSSSPTTSKHINYVAKEYNYEVVRGLIVKER